MTKHTPSIALVAISMLSLIWMPTAPAKQQCSAEMPANSHAYWSWRLIDGRKCWYEGKSMLSKSSLEWPKQTSAQSVSSNELASTAVEKPSDPLDAQARVDATPDDFEAMWRARIEEPYHY